MWPDNLLLVFALQGEVRMNRYQEHSLHCHLGLQRDSAVHREYACFLDTSIVYISNSAPRNLEESTVPQ
jgi:hypothetical protein